VLILCKIIFVFIKCYYAQQFQETLKKHANNVR
jgi:hypothetical protein